ncbi:hypothetical protein PACTADRAFT_33324 [Pachysolen tannophilus NRRL Y-2460]|uniref:Uncharacterized protein n=1 Tax=Pachysolen tannophilus NRRL Y-2460 TaxID=669874 RepID=A0A1E4TWI6_PACTA|nr:hypothetical protein PACTADRAFT_33324 [Pachysolen tannophilus NRRL Y-2460]
MEFKAVSSSSSKPLSSAVLVKIIAPKLQKLKWLLKLIVNPNFYDLINNSIFENSYNLDSTLSTICYLALFASQVLLYQPKIILYLKKLIILIKKKYNININLFNDINEKENNKEQEFEKKEPIINEKILIISQKLKLLSSYISDVRIFNRMWATLPLASWMFSTFQNIYQKPSNQYSNFNKLLDFLQVTSCFLLQLFENIGFLGDHKFINQLESKSLWYNIWCCKLWGFYVILDIIKNFEQLLKRKGGSRLLALYNIDDDLNQKFISNIGDLPLTIHWSMEKGCLSPLAVGFFGTLSRGSKALNVWKNTFKEISKL